MKTGPCEYDTVVTHTGKSARNVYRGRSRFLAEVTQALWALYLRGDTGWSVVVWEMCPQDDPNDPWTMIVIRSAGR